MKQTAESFWARVQQSKGNKCWEWQGSCNNTGYGTVSWHGKVYTTHRVAAWLSGMVNDPKAPAHKHESTHVLHTCDNRKCCNPKHFFLGSYSDNQRDAYSKKRRSQAKGAAHVNAKLTMGQVKDIRKSYAAGQYQQPLAEKYGVSQRVISLIVRGESYK
jgi:hypothetical protein